MLPQIDAQLLIDPDAPIKLSKNDKLALELESVRIKNDKKLLVPSEVVEFARDENTELHKHFEWDDAKAAHQYRIWQARQIIASVQSKEYENQIVQGYYSLPQDRVNPNGGYRSINEILSNDELRKQLLESAKKDADLFRKKYIILKELTPIFNSFDKVFNSN